MHCWYVDSIRFMCLYVDKGHLENIVQRVLCLMGMIYPAAASKVICSVWELHSPYLLAWLNRPSNAGIEPGTLFHWFSPCLSAMPMH